jgi:potassium voltage-gated channel Eag-related subfamily H protein 7
MLIGAEMGPVTNLQRIYTSVMIISGAIFQAVLFGEMAVLMSNLNAKTSRFQEIQDTTNTTMKNMKLPLTLQFAVTDYLVASQNKLDFRDEYDHFDQILAPSLKEEMKAILYVKLRDNPLFHGEERLAIYTLNKLENEFTKPEQDITTQGERGDDLYFVAQGSCIVKMIDHKKRERLVRIIKQGEHFGELSMLYPTVRTCTV